MFTPYDWQEGIGNRAQYIEGRLAQGAPVLAVSLEAGILVFTFRRQARKIYEIYDRLIFAGMGQQSDVEALRGAALEFASREGYNRSEEDVTIQRVATAMSGPIKRAFADFSAAPVVARSLFGEVNARPEEDLYYAIDYDGDYTMSRRFGVVAGTETVSEAARERLANVAPSLSPEAAMDALREIWVAVQNPEGSHTTEELTKGLSPEAILLERSDARENRFRLLTPEEF
jgi:proteasome alpha subunit